MGDQKHSHNLREDQRVPQSWDQHDVPTHLLPTQPTCDVWAHGSMSSALGRAGSCSRHSISPAVVGDQPHADVAVEVDPHGKSPCLDSGAKQKECVLR